MEVKITDYLATYAAALSTLVFTWNLLQSKAKIKANLLPGIETINGNAKSGYFLIIQNVSSQVVPIGSIGLLCHFKRINFWKRMLDIFRYKRFTPSTGWVHIHLPDYSIETGCPMKLDPRSSHKVFIKECTVEELLEGDSHRSIKVIVQDQLWNNYYSKAIKVPAM